MPEEIVTVNGTEVIVTDTFSGFEAREAMPAEKFVREAEKNDAVKKVNGGSSTVTLCYAPDQTGRDGGAHTLDVPEEATILTMEQNKGFDTRTEGGVYLRLGF